MPDVQLSGHGPEDAQDLTGDFFAQFLQKYYPAWADSAKGKFRTLVPDTVSQVRLGRIERTPSSSAIDEANEPTPLRAARPMRPARLATP